MSTTYSAWLRVGITVGAFDLLRFFRADRPEKSHMKDRFDPDTGKKVGQVKVVDEEACRGWSGIGGSEKFHEELDEALEELCDEVLECNWEFRAQGCISEDQDSPEEDGPTVVLFFKGEDARMTGKDEYDGYYMDLGSSVLLGKDGKVLPALKALASRVKRLGAKPSAPKVVCCGGGG